MLFIFLFWHFLWAVWMHASRVQCTLSVHRRESLQERARNCVTIANESMAIEGAQQQRHLPAPIATAAAAAATYYL